jgi:poly(A) polymerase
LKPTLAQRRELDPTILPRPEHPISRKKIDPNAVRVLYRLQRAGFKAYLVGGSVRDLMLGRQPKDFDAATDAKPQEIKRLFRNSRIIGRRFRLVHVFFKGGIVEVATFRRDPPEEDQDSAPGELLITSDNRFGTPREDAFRRDFTINALFYDISDFSLIDYVGGIEDLKHRLIRVIGDPGVRFREDPVRMLRACEFAARLGFGIEQQTEEAIHRHRKELSKASPARVSEEVLALLRCGHAGTAIQWLHDLDLLEVLLPEAYAMVSTGERGLADFARVLPTLDRWMGENRELSDGVVLALILLPTLLLKRYDLETEGGSYQPLSRSEIDDLVEEVSEPFIRRFSLSRARSQAMLFALIAFLRFGAPKWRDADRDRFVRRPGFQDALTLLEILVAATGEGGDELKAWRKASKGIEEDATPSTRRPGGRGRPRRRRRKGGGGRKS